MCKISEISLRILILKNKNKTKRLFESEEKDITSLQPHKTLLIIIVNNQGW